MGVLMGLGMLVMYVAPSVVLFGLPLLLFCRGQEDAPELFRAARWGLLVGGVVGFLVLLGLLVLGSALGGGGQDPVMVVFPVLGAIGGAILGAFVAVAFVVATTGDRARQAGARRGALYAACVLGALLVVSLMRTAAFWAHEGLAAHRWLPGFALEGVQSVPWGIFWLAAGALLGARFRLAGVAAGPGKRPGARYVRR